MEILIAECLGTAILILFGDGVVANVLLKRSKAESSGWIVITAGWAFGVAIAVYVTGWASGAHLNPAVTVALWNIGKVNAGLVWWYISGQMLGAFLGGVLVWLFFYAHWQITEESGKKLAVFCTSPAVNMPLANLFCEFLGTLVLVLGILGITAKYNNLSSGLAPFLVGILVWAIGLSLGGTTGYAINPARDFGPRLAHALLPIPGKGNSGWDYAVIPIIGPLLGGMTGAWLYTHLLPYLLKAQEISKLAN
jgi:glycerol uptake facilitator protein